MINDPKKTETGGSLSYGAGARIVMAPVPFIARANQKSTTVSAYQITEVDAGVLPADCDMDQARETLAGMVLAQDLTAAEMELILSVFDSWAVGVDYSIDDLTRYEGALYKVNIAHKSQSDWPPDTTANLFSPAAPAGVIPLWVQPTGAHDDYAVGDMVQYKEKIWQSKIDANITVPDGDEPYNRYWEDLGAI